MKFAYFGRSRDLFFVVALLAYVFALFAFYFHAVDLNPQYDTQGIRYGAGMAHAIGNNTVLQWIQEPPIRKYPTLYILPFAVVFKIISLDGLSQIELHYAARALTLLYAIGVFIIVWRLSKHLLQSVRSSAFLLLMTSINFFMFSTAVRPHIAVAFWTMLALYFSVLARENLGRRYVALSYISAICAFATLQSGVFAFIFPIHALLEKCKNKHQLLVLALISVIGLTISFAIGYPQVIFSLSDFPSESAYKGIWHDAGFQLKPLLIPKKIWMLFTSDPFLILMAAAGSYSFRSHVKKFEPIYYYIFAFLLIFGMQDEASIRYFVPLLAMLALIGACQLQDKSRLQIFIAICLIFSYGRLGFLALQPNTFQQASKYIIDQPGTFLFTGVPHYFLNLPTDRYATSTTSLDKIFYLAESGESKSRDPSSQVLQNFVASNVSTFAANTPYMFFWNDMQWPHYYIFTARRLGRNLSITSKFSK